MRIASVQRATQKDEMSLRMRRPPEEYVSLLSQNEQEFRTYVHSFEDNPMFNSLVSEGIVSRVRLRGKIPRGKYEEFMDEQLLDFLKQFKITEVEGWERDFLSPHALSRVAELAGKYQVPHGLLLRHLRYLRSSDRGNLPQRAMGHVPASSSDNADYDRIDASAAPAARVDLTDTIETTRDFVERYTVSEQEFLDLILGGEATPEELAARFGCSLLEAEEVLEATDRVYVAESYENEPTQARKKGAGNNSGARPEDTVAFAQMIDGQLALQFDNDSIYTQRYRIKRDLKSDSHLPAATRELLTRARFINQRLSALSRLITTLCAQQTEYLSSGDMRQLRPLAQAELARQLGEHPSTVSRLIRGKSIDTPWGKMPLLFLCQSKTDVVARLIAEFPGLTDQDVVSRLREDHACFIARRTVAYHRGKRVRRNKRHKNSTADAATDTVASPSVAANAAAGAADGAASELAADAARPVRRATAAGRNGLAANAKIGSK